MLLARAELSYGKVGRLPYLDSAADPRHESPVSCPLAACSHGRKVANRLKTNAVLTKEEDNCDCVSVSNRYFGPWAVSLGWQLIWPYDAL